MKNFRRMTKARNPLSKRESTVILRLLPDRAWILRIFPVFSLSLREPYGAELGRNPNHSFDVRKATNAFRGSDLVAGWPRSVPVMRCKVVGASAVRPQRETFRFMVTRAGPLASLDREPRQAREGAAVTVDAGAGVWLVRVAS